MSIFSNIFKAISGAVTAPWFGPVGTLVGGILQNRSNEAITGRQMSFQERMSSTAHQREVLDLEAAGLNPILSSRYGGSSAPQGAAIPAQNIASGLPAAISSAVQLRRVAAEMENLAAQTDLNRERINTERTQQSQNVANSALSIERANTERTNQEFTHARTQTEYQNAQIAAQTFQNKVAEGRILWEQVTQEEAKAIAADIERRIDQSGYGETIRWLNRMGVTPAEVISGLGRFIPSLRLGGKSRPGFGVPSRDSGGGMFGKLRGLLNRNNWPPA